MRNLTQEEEDAYLEGLKQISEPVNEFFMLRDITIKKGQIYRHFKGTFYEIICTAMHTETGEIMVVYKSDKDGIVYARPYNMFVSKVDKGKYPEVNQEYRFQYCRDMY